MTPPVHFGYGDLTVRSTRTGITLNPVLCKMRQGSDLSAFDEAMILRGLKAAVRYKNAFDLVREGDSPDGLLSVLEGFACRYKVVEGGARQIVAIMTPGDFCNVQAALLRDIDHGIATLGPCRLVIVPRTMVEDWRSQSAGIRRALDWATFVDEAILREWLVNLGARDSLVRTAHLFCELRVRLHAVGIEHDREFSLPLTQEDLGDALGLSVVHMNRVLKRLREQGLVTFKSGKVRISDFDRLAAAAGFRGNYLHR